LIQSRTGVSVAVQNARLFLLLNLAACGAGQTAPPGGSLNLAVSGLPSGVTADVTATAATGGVASQNITFVPGPSPTGWQMSKQSLMALMSAVG